MTTESVRGSISSPSASSSASIISLSPETPNTLSPVKSYQVLISDYESCYLSSDDNDGPESFITDHSLRSLNTANLHIITERDHSDSQRASTPLYSDDGDEDPLELSFDCNLDDRKKGGPRGVDGVHPQHRRPGDL